jgi:hypothetical protein
MHLVAKRKGWFGKLSKCSIHFNNQQVQLEGTHSFKHEVVVGVSIGVVVVVYLAQNYRIKTIGFDMCTVTEMTI